MGCYLIKLGRLVVRQYFSLLCICYFFYDSNLTTSAYNKTCVVSYWGWGLLMKLMNGCCLIKLGRLVVHQYFSLLLCICYFFYYSKLTTSACNRTLVLSYGQCGISNVQKDQSSVSLVDCVNLRLVRNWVWIIILLVRHSMSRSLSWTFKD